MRHRITPYVSLLGIALSCLLLLAFGSSRRSQRKRTVQEQPQMQPIPVPPAAAHLRSVYEQLPREARIDLARGLPFGEMPFALRKAVRDAVVEQNLSRDEYAKGALAEGRIVQREYDEDRAYDRYVVAHLDDYRIQTNGDGFATVLFRTLLPDHDLPKEDSKHQARGICRIQ